MENKPTFQTTIAKETRETVNVNRTLIEALEMYVEALKK